MWDIRPGNSSVECFDSCAGNENTKAGEDFCNCIYKDGKPFGQRLEEYEETKESGNVNRTNRRAATVMLCKTLMR